MPISIKCSCGRKLVVNDNFAGRKAQCPVCKTIHEIPTPQPSIIQVEEKPEAAQAIETVAPARCAACGIAIAESAESNLCASCTSEPVTEEGELEGRRVEAKLRLDRIQEEMKGEQAAMPARYIPPNAGFAKTRESSPTMMRTKKPDKETMVRSAPVPDSPATMPIPTQAPAKADDFELPKQDGGRSSSSVTTPSVADLVTQTDIPKAPPRAPDRLYTIAGATAAAALLFCLRFYIPENLSKISSFAAVALCVLACFYALAETKK